MLFAIWRICFAECVRALRRFGLSKLIGINSTFNINASMAYGHKLGGLALRLTLGGGSAYTSLSTGLLASAALVRSIFNWSPGGGGHRRLTPSAGGSHTHTHLHTHTNAHGHRLAAERSAAEGALREHGVCRTFGERSL